MKTPHTPQSSLRPARSHLATAACALLLGLLPIRAAQAEPPRFELIYTQPAETDLVQPLRPPAPLWTEVFATATKTIDIEQFYLAEKAGEALDPVLQALEKSARRGVHVRVLVEDKMRKQSQPTLDKLATWPHTEVRVISWAKLDPGGGRKGGGIIHAKFWIVDGRLSYLGSQNFDWRSLSQIHELGALIRDQHITQQLQAIFDHDWQAQALLAAGKPVPPLSGAGRAETEAFGYLVASPREWLPAAVGHSERELVRLIDATQHHIQIQVMKYAPLSRDHRYYGAIDGALRAAAARGVGIQLLVANWNTDPPGISWLQSLSVIPGIDVKIVTIPEAKSGPIPYARVIHSKYAVFDDKTLWLGTSNWEGGYLDESRNVELVLPIAELVAKAQKLHAQLWSSPLAQPIEACKTYPKWQRN